ncbi:MAG: hypothetical protein Q4D19_01695 [Lautropia sp.]|nr:hypothetical protein [Lautropia sp.]
MPEDSSTTSPAPVAAPFADLSADPAIEAPVSPVASPYTAAQDDAIPPPSGGWHRLIWSLILLIGLVSAAGTGLLVYFLARQTF